MTIHKNDIIEMVRKILRHQEGLQDKAIMHPVREWFIGLGIGLMLFIVIAVSSGYLYWRNRTADAGFDVPPPEVTVYRGSMVKDALTLYKTRDRERQALMGEVVPVPPPVPEVSTSTATSSETMPMATSTATSS